jgi:hypothetical protein
MSECPIVVTNYEPAAVTPPVLPVGYTELVGILRDGAGDPITGLLLVEVPFAMKTTEPALIPPGSFSIFLVDGVPCKGQEGTSPAWLPITATATPQNSYLKLKVRFKHGAEKDLGRVLVPDAPETNIAAIVGV